ncbi:MAG: hypothetical protein ABI878_09540 [Acidobacteriota bacterium]
MSLITNGFADDDDLLEHFDFHVVERKEFQHLHTAEEYLAEADKFLTDLRDSSKCHQCFRSNKDGSRGDMIRYNKETQQFAVLTKENVIRTYFIVDISVHEFISNYQYFVYECGKKK